MSLVTDFIKSMHAQAAPMIGQDDVVIGNLTLSCTLTEVTESRDFTETGFDPTSNITAVCLSSALPSTSLLQKLATARGGSFRVVAVAKGGTFTTLTLETITKA